MKKNNKISTIFTKQKFENRQVFACFGVPPPPPQIVQHTMSEYLKFSPLQLITNCIMNITI